MGGFNDIWGVVGPEGLGQVFSGWMGVLEYERRFPGMNSAIYIWFYIER